MIAESRPQRICVVTGTRADYGLLEPVISGIANAPDLELRLVVTGMHLSPEFGDTWRAIDGDGHTIDAKVEMLLSSDSGVGIAKSMGLGMIGMADAFDRLEPDLVLVLGDRFEALATTQAALVARIPVAHVAGGDVTEGSLDEAMRHAISKLAHVHFATNEDAARRLRSMGEPPDRVHVTGSPGIDRLLRMPRLTRGEFAETLGITLRERLVAVSYHPPTAHKGAALRAFDEILGALDDVAADASIVITGSNADQEGRALLTRMRSYAADHPGRVVAATSLGSLRYLSLLEHADVLVGNSSSGLYEAPSFGTPTVNVGDRQGGRLRASSVLDVGEQRSAIADAICTALRGEVSVGTNPYGDGSAAMRIMAVLRTLPSSTSLLVKPFYEGVHDGT